jgi:nitroreductase
MQDPPAVTGTRPRTLASGLLNGAAALFGLGALLSFALLAGEPVAKMPASSSEAAASAKVPNPLPKPDGLGMSVGEALRSRRSARSYDADKKLTQGQIATLLWAAAGLTRPDPSHPQGGKRTAPSAFGSASIDVYLTSAEGTFLYSHRDHALLQLDGGDLRARLAGADWAKEAPILLILVADLTRYPERAPPAERRDYAFADGAAAGENVYLAATALGLGTCLTMSSGVEVGKLLGLVPDRQPLFAFPVGYEKGGSQPGK